MKKKKHIFRKILLILAIVIVAGIAVDVCITEITARKIPHHFASAKEGRERLLANTEYYDDFTQNDIDFRIQKSGATLDELLEVSTEEIKSFNIFEKYYIDHCLAKMERTIQKNGYELPELEEIVFIKSDMSVESGNSGYTHGTEIYLNTSIVETYSVLGWIPGFGQYSDELLWHEMFHCLTRSNSEFRAEMYSLINFTVTDTEFELPPCVADQYFSNPDVEHHNSYATFIVDDREIDCFTAWIVTESYEEAQSGFSGHTATVLIPIDGSDIYYTPEETSNFDEVFGTNTGYVIDPEECMADNFAYAMLYGMEGRDGQGYPNPEIIQGVIDALSK